jgi:hypothetical protein
VIRAMVVGAVAVSIAVAHAQPVATTSDLLREGNAAALAGDWRRVAEVVDPLLRHQLAQADLGETHRLAGLAAFFLQRTSDAESHFLAYLEIEIDGRLDSALYPPEVVMFFNDVTSRHAAGLRALRNQRKQRSWWLTLLPPFGQFQNGDRVKGYVVGGALGGLLVANLTTYAILRSWCNHASGPAGGSLICNNNGDHRREAVRLRPYNVAFGIGVILMYAYGVFDGVQGYRRRSRENAIRPFAAMSASSGVVGVTGRF